MKKIEDIIWDYLDGECTPEEKAILEQKLATDQVFQQLFLQSQVLHKNLQEVEVESPSMRFSQNVMDKLPPIRNLATAPLVSKRWLRIFGSSIASLVLFFFGGSLSLITPASSQGSSSHWILDFFSSIFNYLPANTLFFSGIITAALLSLLFLDRWLERRFR